MKCTLDFKKIFLRRPVINILMFSLLIRNLLSMPIIYSSTMVLLGNKKITKILVDEYLCPKKGARMLDIGCGPADILSFLPDVEYFGFDLDAGYIDAAKKRYGKRGTFLCKKVSMDALDENEKFDLILAKGVLHHLNDTEATDMFELAHTHLTKEGRLITFDGCYVPEQSYFAKIILDRDRGKYVRTKEAYMKLATHSFLKVTPTIYHDLLIIPYTHIIMECTK